MKTAVIFVAATLWIVGSFGALVVYLSHKRASQQQSAIEKTQEDRSPSVECEPSWLKRGMRENEAAFTRDYHNKWAKIKGKVSRVKLDSKDLFGKKEAVLILNSGLLSSVDCHFENPKILESIRPDVEVTIIGKIECKPYLRIVSCRFAESESNVRVGKQ